MNTASNDFIISHYSKHLSYSLISSYKLYRVDVTRPCLVRKLEFGTFGK